MTRRLKRQFRTVFIVLFYINFRVSANYNYEPTISLSDFTGTGMKTHVYKAQVGTDPKIPAYEDYYNYRPIKRPKKSCAYDFAKQRKLANNNNLPSLAIVVNSAVNHHDARNTIRQTWYKKERAPDDLFVFKTVFSVGKCDQSNRLPKTWPETVCNRRSLSVTDWSADICKKAIMEEALEHGDILQSIAIDTYYNLTKKTSTTIHWAADECKSDFVIFIDDDYDFSIRNLYKFLLENVSVNQTKKELFTHSSNRSSKKMNFKDKLTTLLSLKNNDAFFGNVHRNSSPARDVGNKWYVSFEEYKQEYYPDFINFGFVLMSKKTFNKIHDSMQVNRLFVFNDVWVAHMAQDLNIKPAHSNVFFCRNTILDSLSTECVAWHDFNPTELKRHWDKLEQMNQQTDCDNELPNNLKCKVTSLVSLVTKDALLPLTRQETVRNRES